MDKLEKELNDLEYAEINIVEAMNNLEDVGGLDEEYKQLDFILQNIEDKKLEIKIELDNLQEEAYFKENEEIWKKEKQQELFEYWREAL